MKTEAVKIDSDTLADGLVSYPEIARQLERRRPVLFLDYDGTLTPIADRPELAVLAEPIRATLRELASLCCIAVVSGRDRADVKQRVGLDELIYAGSHGFDISGPGGLRKQHECAEALLPALDRAQAQLDDALAEVAGALVERKRFAIAVHYRLVAPEQVATVAAAVDAVVAACAGQLRKSGGKKIFELKPNVAWDKGQAALWLLESMGAGPLPLYLGDDETDEDAFIALRNAGGIGILVATASQSTAARYVLKDPDAVGRFLHKLVATLRRT